MAGVGALLEFLAADPEAARLAFIEVMTAGPAGLERYRFAERAFAAYLEEVARESGYEGEVSEHAGIAAISGMVAVIAELVREGRTAELPQVRDELTQFGIAIFTGSASAERAVREGRAELDRGASTHAAAIEGTTVRPHRHGLLEWRLASVGSASVPLRREPR